MKQLYPMKTYTKTIVLCLLCLQTLSGIAQSDIPAATTFKITPPSPNAAALGIYGDVPVSEYSGMLGLSIPLYEILEKDLGIPISLSYRGEALKVKEEATWVGLGWALNAGGVITRSIRGRDELSTSSNYFNSPLPITDQGGAIGINCFFNGSQSHSNYLALTPQQQAAYDFQPDYFYFNFLNYIGKFIIDQQGVFHVMGKTQNLEIGFINPSAKQAGFKIRTPDGNVFYFRGTESTVNETLNNPIHTSGTTAYGLSGIKTVTGDSVTFEYNAFQKFQTRSTSIVKYSNTNFYLSPAHCISQSPSSWPQDLEKACTFWDKNFQNISYSTSTVDENLLTKIKFSNGYVEFYSSPTRNDLQYNGVKTRKLDSIVVFNKNSYPVRRFKFTYDYFLSSGTDIRLKLTSVGEPGLPAHQFAYNNHKFRTRTLDTEMGDMWGNNDYLETGDIAVGLTPKEIYEKPVRAAMLEKVIYPTGGETVIEYESHTFKEDLVNYSVPYQEFYAERYDSASYFLNTPATVVIDGKTPVTVIVELEMRLANGAQYTGPNEYNAYKIHVGSAATYTPGAGTFRTELLTLKPGSYPITISPPLTFDMRAYIRVRYYKQRFGGGLRVKKIIDKDPINDGKEYKVKNYQYGTEVVQTIKGQSVTLEGTPFGKHLSLISNSFNYSFSPGTNCQCSRTETYQQSIVPLSTSGAIVGYDSVVIVHGISKDQGKVVKSFVNENDIPFGTFRPFLPSVPHIGNGSLLKETEYNSGGKRVQETTNTYATLEYSQFFENVILSDPLGFLYIKARTAMCGNPENCPAGSYVLPMPMNAEWLVLQRSVSRKYNSDGGGNYLETVINYSYDDDLHKLPTVIESFSSAKDTIRKYLLYPADYTNTTGFIGELKKSFIHAAPVEVVTTLSSASGTQVVSGQLMEYKVSSKGLLDNIKILDKTIPPALGSFKFSNQSLAGKLPFKNAAGSYSASSLYESKILFEKYDDLGNIIQQRKINDMPESIIWDYNKEYAVAEAVNADSISIAYTSFEADGTGNWIVPSSLRESSAVVTGKKAYNLINGAISKTGLSSGATYLLTYWSRNGALSVTGTVTGWPKQLKSINFGGQLWTLHEHKLTGVTSVQLSGAAIIDEVRLHPAMAMMTTYTHSPLVGLTSKSDNRNYLTFYEYDGYGRLILIRDEAGNILKQYCYGFQGQASPCVVNPQF